MKRLARSRFGEIPLLQIFMDRLRFKEVLSKYLTPHKNELIPAVETLLLMVCNIACGRQPLYELLDWANQLDHRAFGKSNPNSDQDCFNDDRCGRALDKLFHIDRASLITDITMNVIKATDIDVNQLHNDSTSIKTTGSMPKTSATGLTFKYGHSKDHRPDLKQIIYNLTITADGAIPLHYKTYPGNRTDDTLHIEIWDTLTKLTGKSDFLYVADCKVCTQKQLEYITTHNGKVITVMPKTWKEYSQFMQAQKTAPQKKQRILRRKKFNSDEYESFYKADGDYSTENGFQIFWIYTSKKRANDFASRKKRLSKSEQALTELLTKLNTRNLKTQEQIQHRVNDILKVNSTGHFFNVEIGESTEIYQKQKKRGRPTSDTQYETVKKTIYILSWSHNKAALKQEANTDGYFPILCTDSNIKAKQALEAYKYQPRLERRFYQLKSVLNGAPTLCKNIERVESMMLLFYLALIMQSAIERQARKKMGSRNIESLAIYPEERPSSHPTTDKIFDRFHDLSSYQIHKDIEVVEEHFDELTSVHKEILELLNMTEQGYWNQAA